MIIPTTKVAQVPKEPHWAVLVNDSYYDHSYDDRYPYLKYYSFKELDEVCSWLQTQKDLSLVKVLWVEPKAHKTLIEVTDS